MVHCMSRQINELFAIAQSTSCRSTETIFLQNALIQGSSVTEMKRTKLSYIKVHDRDLLFSFEVNSLFTKVPIDETLKTVAKKLGKDEALEERTRDMPQIYAFPSEQQNMGAEGWSSYGFTIVPNSSQYYRGILSSSISRKQTQTLDMHCRCHLRHLAAWA